MSTYLAEDKMDILEQLNVNLTLFIEHFSETSKNYSLLPYPPIYNCDELDGVMAVPLFRYSVISFYSVIFVMSLLGNGLVCYAVLVSQKMKTVTNFFIINLSTNDIILTLFCVPFSASEKFLLQRWPFGNSLCHIVSFVQAVSVYVSAYTLVAISIDRYMAIMWPLRPRMSKGHAKFVIVTIWLTAMVTAVPVFVTTGQTIPNDTFYEFCEFYICGEDWEDPEMKTAYSILVAMLQYGVPLVVLVFTYTSIAIVVWGKQPPGEAENQRDRRMAKSKRKRENGDYLSFQL
ncbi:hypothetical protein M8J75_006568 [Diaphorina citri]|nr:hypothetical protein M8J75_006568 [Diaphorina citri]